MTFLLNRVFFLTVLMMALSAGLVAAESRKPAVADQFYPGNPDELSRVVDGFLESASPSVTISSSSRLVGLIIPHAGYVFSGQTAAVGFKAVAGQPFDRIYFLGVDHHTRLPSISVWTEGAFDTPLGPVPLDASASLELVERGGIYEKIPEQHLLEHSIEVLLPFFIKTAGWRPAVFLTVGGMPTNGITLGRDLIRLLSKTQGRVLIVASTDWSHYHDSSTAKTLDDAGIQSALQLDPTKLMQDCLNAKTELCGLNGVLALLTVMKSVQAKPTLLQQTDSSQASGDHQRVVGYASILFESAHLPAEPGIKPAITASSTGQLATSSKEEIPVEFQHEALSAVRKTLETILSGKPVPAISFQHPRFKEHCGIFVTLKKHGELRGCIGLIEGFKPLAEAIQEMAVAAATQDPRFPAVTLAELKEIDIEISVLTPPVAVKELSDIQVGRDGVILRKQYHSGVFLPQVATEQGWDRDTFLENLCYKAGLPAGSHLDQTAKLFRFTADVFGEK